MFERGFGSDNHAPVHPQILQALIDANRDHAPSYGTDTFSEKLNQVIQDLFGSKTQAFPVFNGTASNVLALQTLVRPFERILCSDVSHLQQDECGAPEFFLRSKLEPLPSSEDGKIDLLTLKKSLIRRGDQHYSQPRVVSLTQPTELGGIYSLEEIKGICEWAHKEGLWVHIDGARFANASYHLQKSFKEMSSDLGVDVLSFGGTKNGLLFGELVIFLNPRFTDAFKYIRKQSAQLPSKTRYLSAQFLTYFSNDLWKTIAHQSCSQALHLYEKLRNFSEIKIRSAPQSNVLFACFPIPLFKELRKNYFFYVWDEKTFEVRLMTSWDTQDEEIQGFVDIVQNYYSQTTKEDL